MFHWICPECGREIPPTVRECRSCDPAAAVPDLPPAREVAEAAPVVAEHERFETAVAVAELPPPPPAEVLPAPLAEAVGPALDIRPEVPRFRIPSLPAIAQLPPPERPALLLEAPALVPKPEVTHSTHLERLPSPAALRSRENPARDWQTILEPARTKVSTAIPSVSASLASRQPGFARLVAEPAPPPRSAKSKAVSLEEPKAIEIPPSFGVQTLKAEDARLGSGPAPAISDFQDYTASAFRQMRPVSPEQKVLRPDLGRRTTLPGPALPHSLQSLSGAGISKIRQERVAPSPATTARWGGRLALTALISAGVTGLIYVLPHLLSGGSYPPAPQHAQAATTPAAQTTSVAATYPLAKSVEVTGFRFIDSGKRQEVHYLIVNHSSAALGDVTLFVTLWASGTKPGQPPLLRYSLKTPGIGPYEAKEMTTAVDKMPRSASLPEWQDLRVQVEVGQ
jgi:hypothetical protein